MTANGIFNTIGNVGPKILTFLFEPYIVYHYGNYPVRVCMLPLKLFELEAVPSKIHTDIANLQSLHECSV